VSPAFQGLVTSPWLGTDLTGQAKRVVSQATMDNVPGEIHKDAKKALRRRDANDNSYSIWP